VTSATRFKLVRDGVTSLHVSNCGLTVLDFKPREEQGLSCTKGEI
jgi:hypothetical protein